MKRLSIILIIALLVTGTFGFTAMNHSGGCSFAFGGNGDCPPTAIGMIMHHVDSYLQFFSSMPVTTSLSVLAMALLVLSVFDVWPQGLKPPRRSFAFERVGDRGAGSTKDSNFIRWLSLFENSPSFE